MEGPEKAIKAGFGYTTRQWLLVPIRWLSQLGNLTTGLSSLSEEAFVSPIRVGCEQESINNFNVLTRRAQVPLRHGRHCTYKASLAHNRPTHRLSSPCHY